MADFIYITGPEGHSVRVDDNGMLLVNADASTSGFIFGYGETGYPLAVDGNGRLLVNTSGLEVSLSGDYYEKDSDLLPDSPSTYDLGAISDRFAILYAESGNFSEGIDIGGNTHLTPEGTITVGESTITLANLSTEPTPWTSGAALLPDLAGCHGKWVYFKGSLFGGKHGWLGGTSPDIVKLTPNGDTFTTALISTPSGQYAWSLHVVADRLYVGTGEGAGAYICYSDDGVNFTYLSAVDDGNVTAATALGDYQGKLVIGHNYHDGSKHSILELRTDRTGQTFEIGELCKAFVGAPNWGWDYGLDACGGKLFTFTNFGDILNVYDGVFSIGSYLRDPYGTGGAGADIGKALELNGDIFLFGDNIYEYVEAASGSVDIVRLRKAQETAADIGLAYACPATAYNNKLWAADTNATIYCYDGVEWTIDTALSGVVSATPRALVPLNDKLYLFNSDGTFWYMQDGLGLSKFNCSQSPKFHNVRYIKSLARFTGQSEVPVPSYNGYNPSGMIEQPHYTSTSYVAQHTSLASGISQLDKALTDLHTSGTELPVSADFGDEFYIPASGWYKYGFEWRKITE